ncbi:hypothetical protein FACS189415_8240 [Bacteroidia bacterium]|nr:hypothetical protein FACS189415_8240 [Bacteroidia bacterium]
MKNTRICGVGTEINIEFPVMNFKLSAHNTAQLVQNAKALKLV